ncbi:MAG TPA: hypothetical protein VKQ06_11965, partial [Gammaproteobacteria bacterium]|nr:hypothetical protein [Gammaproteobacteria bacterium]
MELRHTRRLVRYWVFVSIAFILGLAGYGYYSALHALFSAVSASVGMIGPRYLMMAIASYYITGFVLGIVFLGFDIRARDIRESIVEVLDSRPLTNLELVAGRFFALFLAGWVPIVILAVLIQGAGWLLPMLGSPFGRTVQPWSLLSFVFLMGMPAIAFAVALVFTVTLLVRNRLVAAVVSIAAIVGIYAALFTIPGTYGVYADFFGAGSVAFPSDIVPGIALASGWMQRLGFLIIALGLVGIAAVLHPRLDGGTRLRPAATSAAILAVGFATLLSVSLERLGEAGELERWRAAHAARAAEPIADVRSITGVVSIEPGERLAAELELELAAPPDRSLSRVLLTLNPGLQVERVAVDGRPMPAEHTDGLLDIELDRALAPGERTTVTLQYSGLPNVMFGYLDSAINLQTVTMAEAQIGVLGFENGIFDSRYVALMPGFRWLPASGVDVGTDDPRTRRRDYFNVALDVTVPQDWLVAGPGRRETLTAAADRATFRFAPAVSIAEVALIAA